MTLISFINKKTYEITDEIKDYIYCDYDLRYIIAELNKKGYKTKYSCSGHNKVGLLEHLQKTPIKELDTYLKISKKDSSLHLIGKDKEYFYHKDEKVSTHPYILFMDDYKFKAIPKDFVLEVIDGKSCISKKISYYKNESNTVRKTDKEIFEELNQTYIDLQQWVDNLENINTKTNYS